ncbi:MAG: hypothetical protein HKN71_12425, partial [Gemmatimonadetes bacterium]|nr:hypothetical protein [Gemmatimonadota bacterium]
MRFPSRHLLLVVLLSAPFLGCPVGGSDPDPDRDGLSTTFEQGIGTNPLDPDTDDDGHRDGDDPNPLVPDPPGVPGELWAEDRPGGIRLTWTAAAGRVDEYEICSAPFIFNPFNTCVTVPFWQLSYDDPTLSVGDGRAYWVKAVNTLESPALESPDHDSSFTDPGNERMPVWGARIASGVPPSPRFSADGDDGQIQVDWEPSSDPAVTDYRVSLYANNAVPGFAPFEVPAFEVVVPAGGADQHVFSGLPNGTDYFVRVHAVTAGGENHAPATHQVVVRVALSGAGAPPPPDNLTASQASGYHFDLDWDPGLSNQVEDFDRYRVLRRDTPGGTPVVVAELTDTELRVPVRPAEEAWFSVVTLDEEGLESSELGPASALAPAFPLSDRTLVVWNTNTGDGNGDGVNDSLEVALHYQARRNIPGTHLLGISATANRRYGQGDWALFESEILAPIRSAIQGLGAEQVYYIALMYGVPLYADTQQPFGQTSLDTWVEIALDAPVTIPANALGAAGSTDFELDARQLLSHLDLPPTVNEIDAPFPEETMLFDHTVKRVLPGSVEAEMFLTSRVDGFDALRAKEMVEAALYAEAYLSTAPGHYHGDAYLDRGDIPLGVSLGTPGPMGDFNSDGDPDEAGFWDNGDSDDIDESAIRAAYPGGGYLGFRDSDLDWAFMRLFFEDRGWDTYTEVTASEIGAPGSAWADASVEASSPAAGGTASAVQWALSSYNNTSYADAWTWAVGSVAHDRGS